MKTGLEIMQTLWSDIIKIKWITLHKKAKQHKKYCSYTIAISQQIPFFNSLKDVTDDIYTLIQVHLLL